MLSGKKTEITRALKGPETRGLQESTLRPATAVALRADRR